MRATTSYDDAVTAKFALPRTLKSLLGGSLLVGVSLPVPFERAARFERKDVWDIRWADDHTANPLIRSPAHPLTRSPAHPLTRSR